MMDRRTSGGVAAALTRTVPIVFILGFDAVGLGLIESLSSPGRNVTGFSTMRYEWDKMRAERGIA